MGERLSQMEGRSLRWCAVLVLVLVCASSEGIFEGQSVLSCQIQNSKQAEAFHNHVSRVNGDMWTHHIMPEAPVHVHLHNEHLQEFRSRYGCTTLIANLAEHVARSGSIAESAIELLEEDGTPVRPDEKWFHQYHGFDDQVKKLHQIQKENPDLVKVVSSVSKTHEGRDIPAVHITNFKHPGAKKQIILMAGQHAREWDASSSGIYFAHALASTHDSDPQSQELLKKLEFVVIPNMNPDGYEFSRKTNRLWRKNRRNNGDGTFGVDLNRNWPNHWKLEPHKPRTSAQDYQGPGAASEPEVKGVQEYLQKLKSPIAGVDFHTYGELILRSRGWTKKKSKDENMLKALTNVISKEAAKHGGGKYKGETAAGLYPTTGSVDDWMSENMSTEKTGKSKLWGHGWTVELPPSMKRAKAEGMNTGFMLPAKRILPTARGMLEGVKAFSEKLVHMGKVRMELGEERFSDLFKSGNEFLLNELSADDEVVSLDDM